MVPAPAFIGLDVMEEDVFRRTATFLELLADEVLIIAIGHIDLDSLARGNLAHDARQVLRHSVIFVRKRNPFWPRPAKPRRPVPMPFGRKRVAKGGGGFFKDRRK